jgi:outer membrane receptor for ferrienterochelin and colicins
MRMLLSGASWRLYTQPIVLAVFFCLVQFTASSPVMAQSANSNIKKDTLIADSTQLKEVIVVGQYRPTALSKSLYNVKLITADQIRNKGAVGLNDVLSNELNARVINDNVLGSILLLQGISGQNVKILTDGVPNVGGAGDDMDISQFNLNNIERIEIIQGPLSVQYGTNALAGTVNLVTKELPPGKFSAGISTFAESVGQYNTDVNGGLSFGRFTLRLSGGINHFNGFSSPTNREGRLNDNRSLNWNPKDQYFGNLKFSTMLGGIRAGLSHNQFKENNYSIGAPDAGTQFLTAGDHDYLTDRWNTMVYANGKLPGNGYLDIVNSYQHFERDSRSYITNIQNDTRNFLGNAVTLFKSYVFRGSYSKSDTSGSKLGYQFGYELNLNEASGERILADAGDLNDLGLFASLSYSPIDDLQIQPAARYAWNSQYDTKDINFLGKRIPLITSLNVKYEGVSNLVFRASYAKGYRSPTLKELYYDFRNANHYIVGNELLTPEIADNYIVSANYTLPQQQGEWTIAPYAFLNVINNKIELVEMDRSTIPAAYQSINVVRTYANIPNFNTRGINMTIGYDNKKTFNLSAGGGVLQRSGSNSAGKYFTSFEANSTANYLVRRIRTRVNLYYKYNGALAQFSLIDGMLVDKTLQDYHFLDASLNRSFQQSRLSLTAGVKNLFNVTDVLQTGDSKDSLAPRAGFKTALPMAWGRSAFIKISYQITKK